MVRSALAGLLLPAALVAQATFDLQSPACGYGFPTGCSAVGDAEGVSWNGAVPLSVPAFGATVSTANGLGMPCSGAQFLRLQCANPNFGVVPHNGPIPESNLVARAWIPVPIQDLLNEFSLGFPFTGTLDGAGASTTPAFGPSAALPGLTLYAVTTHWTPGLGAFVASRPPLVYTIP